MFKKIELWIVLLIILIFFILTILYGSLLRNHYLGDKKFKNLKIVAVFFAEIPSNIKNLKKLRLRKTLNNKIIFENKDDMPPAASKKNINKPRFKRFIESTRQELLVLPRYDGDIKRSVVDIIDLNSFKTIHTYKHDVNEMNKLVDINNIENSRVRIDDAEIRFEYRHPLILEDGSLISHSEYAPLFKIDFCSKLVWINQNERFHHSIMKGNNGNILVSSQIYPHSRYISNFIDDYSFQEDAIIILNQDGDILFSKSIVELLAENNIFYESDIFMASEPIHLNDIEPVLKDGKFWKKGDLFLSSRSQSAIIHYRPKLNKVVNYLKGPFYQQHDVDIISDTEISIFNNNNTILKNGRFSEILIYDFETKTFKKKFQKQLEKSNFRTHTQGLSEILEDGSILVEEQNHGRLILFNKIGQKVWEYVNKDKNGDVQFITWSRIIQDETLINKLKDLISNKKCTN